MDEHTLIVGILQNSKIIRNYIYSRKKIIRGLYEGASYTQKNWWNKKSKSSGWIGHLARIRKIVGEEEISKKRGMFQNDRTHQTAWSEAIGGVEFIDWENERREWKCMI